MLGPFLKFLTKTGVKWLSELNFKTSTFNSMVLFFKIGFLCRALAVLELTL